MSKMESILKEIDKLRENEQSIKLNLERISNLEQTIQLLESTINQSKDEFDTEIEYFLSKISELTKNITLWDEKIPTISKNIEIKITKLKTREKKFENKANKITKLKIELKSKDDILNKSHNRIFQKRLLLAQEAGEDWRKMIEDLSEINFKTELEKTTLKISKLDEMQTELLKQKSALENSFRGIQSDLQHLSSLKGEETCPTCKQTLTKETFEELSTTLNSNMKNNQNKIKILNKKIQDLRKEIKEAKEQEKEMRKKNHLYSSLKPNFDELTILENEKDEMEKEVKTLREKLQKLNEEYNQEQLDNMKESISIEEERIKDIQAVKRLLPKLMKIKEKIITDNKQLDLLRKEFSQLKSKLTIKNLKTIEKNISAQEDEYKEFKQLIDELDQIIKDHQNEKTYRNQIKSIHNELLEVESVKDFNEHKKIEDKRIKLGNLISSKEATIRSLKDEVIPPLVEQIKKLENKEKQLKDKEIEIKHERKKVEISSILRGLMRELPNKLLPNFIERINRTATEILQSIMPGSDIQNIVLNDDYSLNIIRLGNYENINVLSGGETIIIALALRLAFAKEFSALDLLILDEPTIFLDERRREELVSVLEKNRLVKQMFVVTHDPDFERISDKTYFITKSAGETTVKTMEEEDEVIESSITNFTL
jgi:exonuclease SbcC